MIYDQRLEGTMQQVGRLAQEYKREQLEWKHRQQAHEEETKRTQKQMAELQRTQVAQPPIVRLGRQVPNTAQRPLPPPVHSTSTDPTRWTTPNPAGMSAQGESRMPENPAMPVPPRPENCATGQRFFGSLPAGALPPTMPTSSGIPSGLQIPSFLAPPVLDACPQLTPSTYQRWKRGLKLRMAGFPTATVSQPLSEIIDVAPQPPKITGLANMEPTEGPTETRSVQALIEQLDTRYGKTDSERSWEWLQFAGFTRKPSGDLKDFWALRLRFATRRQTLNMPMWAEMITPNAMQALKLTESQLPIVLSALETKQNSHIVDILKDLTIRMFETHRRCPESSAVYVTQSTTDGGTDTEVWVTETGETKNPTLKNLSGSMSRVGRYS